MQKQNHDWSWMILNVYEWAWINTNKCEYLLTTYSKTVNSIQIQHRDDLLENINHLDGKIVWKICNVRESNPGLPRGRREFYHWTNVACCQYPLWKSSNGQKPSTEKSLLYNHSLIIRLSHNYDAEIIIICRDASIRGILDRQTVPAWPIWSLLWNR